ncbi:MAG: VWA domain-containing protein [Spirochaetes bacterium]|jgi:Ca-activated chloride channel family protein|nr:VWA domain-containing protein [Spirochaetota bacterium]
MGFGNYKYMIYIAALSGLTLSLFLLYVLWKRRMLSAIFRGGQIRIVQGSRTVSAAREAIIAVSVLLSAFLLLRPQWGSVPREVKSEGSDVLIALDVSPSMLAGDVNPSRLDRARDAVKWLAMSLGGDRMGLILFSGDAFLQCPLTNDIGAFMMFLDGASPDSIGLRGTDIGKALREAARVFTKKRLTTKVLVVITDGEDNEGTALDAIPAFRDLGVSVYTVGIGRDDGDFIPSGEGQSGTKGFIRDSSGNLVRTKKNSSLLKKLAVSTGGNYIDITGDLSGMGSILDIISDQRKNEYGTRIVNERIERFQIFAVVLFLLLSFEMLMAERSGNIVKFVRKKIKKTL